MISPAALQAVSQASAEVRTRAEQEAVSEISAYLRPAYDCDAIFSASGDDRSPLIVMYACDIALYHMAAALPQKLGSEIRAIRYDRAVKWLEGVQAGKILPDLPRAFSSDGSEDSPAQPLIFSSDRKLRNNW